MTDVETAAPAETPGDGTPSEPVEWVYVRLPDHDDSVPPGVVSREAYDLLWKDKGWIEVDAAAAQLAASPEPPAPGSDVPSTAVPTTGPAGTLDNMTRQQLQGRAKELGLTTSSSDTKASLIEAIQNAGG